ncbi:ACP S-malonyltransferase [Candidatus Amarobacter glycogenicus]|uniref:ACP S-malonyltransferase n=1 Tax=Candidatus Amarobacter glycogenicus TaxID=3140699 RepID=UPI003134793F|nr:ACP S-malonyltransferase [Dehalococcoidia bacterium]
MDQEVKPWARLALIFPGQGSQYVGMGHRLSQVSKAARDIFQRADRVLDRNLSKLCWEGPADELESTANQQPASFVTSMAWLEALRERFAVSGRKFDPHLFAGHSMGEFTAAVAAGSLDFEEGLLLVAERGRLMGEAGTENPGGMASILGLPEAKVLEICAEASKEGYVGLANANCDGQSVISGYLKPLTTAIELAEKAKARKVVRLPISIGSHSPLMAKASDGMNALLQKMHIRDPHRPLVGNVNADLLTTGPQVYSELRDQLTHGVLWQKSIEKMRDEGADMFIEVGPGNVLTKLVRRIDYEINSISISDDYEGLLSDRWQLVEGAAR